MMSNKWSRRSGNISEAVIRGSNPSPSIFFAKIPIFHFHGPCRHGRTGRGNEIRNAVFWDIHAHKPNLSGMQTCHGCCLAHSKRKQYQNPTRGFKITPTGLFSGAPRHSAAPCRHGDANPRGLIALDFWDQTHHKMCFRGKSYPKIPFLLSREPHLCSFVFKIDVFMFSSPVLALSRASIFIEIVTACAFSSTET